jgi:ABC-type transport system substrate-binding protein
MTSMPEVTAEWQNFDQLTADKLYVLLRFRHDLYFPEQWDATAPWHDERVRRAANLAIDRNTINEALTLGFSKLTNSIIPDMFEYAWDGSFAGTESSISLPPPQFNLYSRGHVHRAAIRRSSAAGCRRQTMEAPR